MGSLYCVYKKTIPCCIENVRNNTKTYLWQSLEKYNRCNSKLNNTLYYLSTRHLTKTRNIGTYMNVWYKHY